MLHRSDKKVNRVFGHWTRLLFPVAAAIAVIITLISFSGVGPITPASRAMVWLLATNFVLIGILAYRIGREFFGLTRSKSGRESGKLAKNFAILFSLVAVAPTILIAGFLGTSLNRSIESWFSERITNIVQGSASVSRSNLQSIADEIRKDMGIMAIDLNAAVIGFETEPDVFARFLLEQASFREFTGALIISPEGKILLASDPASSAAYASPSPDMYETADSGDISVRLDNMTSRFWALFRLSDFDDAYLYTQRPINPSLLDSLVRSEQTLSDFHVAEEQSRRLQTIFLMGFVQITVLTLLFFIRYGLYAAQQISSPILALARAAENVKNGDLNVQVAMPEQNTEVTELTSSFNAMTERLREQRHAIETASREAIDRSQFIEVVLQGVSAGVVRVDDTLKVTLANPSAIQIFPKLHSEQDVWLYELSEGFAVLVRRVLETGQAMSDTIVLSDEYGQRHFLLRAEPADERQPGCILTFDDTTRLITAQRQMAWRDVARRVAHEIRNPLTPIQLSAERLKRRYRKMIDEDDVVFDRCIDTISRQVGDIGRMVEEFSSFARMPKPELENFDVVGLVKSRVFDARLSKPDIEYEFVTDIQNIELAGDQRLLGQALTNLLKNAGEAVERRIADTKAGIAVPSVKTTLTQIDTNILIEIEDTGSGFPVENRHKVLEPYVTTREEGVGLGLAIVNRVVEDHGGQLTLLDRRDGETGARVSVRLPLSGPDEENITNWTKSEEQMQ